MLAIGMLAIVGAVLFSHDDPKSDEALRHLHEMDKQKTESEPEQQEKAFEGVAKTFVRTWVGNPEAAIALLDPRAPQSVTNVVQSMKLRRFDGEVTDSNEGTVTVTTTGDQIAVFEYDVSPLWFLAERYVPVPLQISVAKDTKKVVSVLPRPGAL
jgi:hypothetical protein